MEQPMARIGDTSSPDACGAPPTVIISGSSNVFINGLGAARVGDSFAPHACAEALPHPVIALKGSSTVYINGRLAYRMGDPTNCGAICATGSPNVFCG